MKAKPKSSLIEVIALWRKRGLRENFGKWLLIFFVLLWFSILVLFPLWGIITETIKGGWRIFVASLTEPASLHAFWLTFIITVAAVTINTLFGVVLAVMFARQNFKGKLLLESIIDLPFAVSPVVAGFMFIILFHSVNMEQMI